MVKVDLVTGFLGSGKTTFIQRYARYLMSKGEKVGIIENDFGAVNVDMMLLQDLEKAGASTEMVIGGDADCYRRRFRTKLIAMGMEGLDRVIVEPSGIYDVDEFFDALYEDPVCRLCEAGNVIAIVDAYLDDQLTEETDYLLVSQLSGAGMVLLSRAQGAAPADILHTIGHINAAMEKFQCRRRFQAGFLGAGSREHLPGSEGRQGEKEASGELCFGRDILAENWDDLTDEDYERIENSGYRTDGHIKLPPSALSKFQSLYYMNLSLTLEEMKAAVHDLMQDSLTEHQDRRLSESIFRIKGFVREETPSGGDGQWYEINATHLGIQADPVPAGQNVLIVIGERLDKEAIDARLGIMPGEEGGRML